MRQLSLGFLGILLGWLLVPATTFGWGAVGHEVLTRAASRIADKHPLLKTLNEGDQARLKSFLRTIQDSRLKLSHVANIPDNYWRDYDLKFRKDAGTLGVPTHFLNSEKILEIPTVNDFFRNKLPLDYEEATKLAKGETLFKVGTVPWRAQQFSDLYTWALKNYPTLDSDTRTVCDRFKSQEPHPTLLMVTFAGLMSHFTGDSSNPYHATADYDARDTGQRGLHSYWESTLVEEIDDAILIAIVTKLAETYLTAGPGVSGSVAAIKAKAASLYPKESAESTAALVIAELGDSFRHREEIRELDRRHAIPTGAEALQLDHCKNLASIKKLRASLATLAPEAKKAVLEQKLLGVKGGEEDICRRDPHTPTDEDGNLVKAEDPGARTIVQRNVSLISSRLAVAAALTADIWVRKWVEAGEPYVCSTYQFPHKPSFISPADPNCFGYATKEDLQLSSWKNAESTAQCVKF